MALAFDAQSELSFTGDNSVTHTPVGTPRAAVVLIVQNNQITDQIAGVTYGGTAMSEVAGSPLVQDAGTEDAVIYAYFLGASIPTGAQSVSVDTTDTAAKRMIVTTLTAATDTSVDDSSSGSGTGADPSITVNTTTGVTTFVLGALHSGQDAVSGITAGSGQTNQREFDFGTQVAGFSYITTNPTGGDVTYDWTAAAEEWGLFALAVKEAGDATATPATIAATVSVPQAAVGVGAAPAVLPATAALPQAGVGVGAAPAVVAATATLPAPAVGVGVAPSPVAAVVALPQASVGVSAAPAVAALLVALPAPAVGVGAAPSVLAAVVALPAPTVSGGGVDNINPPGPTMVGAVAVDSATIVGATSQRSTMIGTIS